MSEALSAVEPELTAVSKMAMTSTPFTEPRTAEFLYEQSEDPPCGQNASTVGTLGSEYSYNPNGFLVHVAPLDEVVLKVIPQ